MVFSGKFSATVMLGLVLATPGHAEVMLFDWGFNLDGTSYCASSVPAGDLPICTNEGLAPSDLPTAIDTSAFNFVTGLGSISATVGGVGPHYFSAFLDHEIDKSINTFFNESGSANNLGDLGDGQSWEIDEPGFVFGDIFFNFVDGMLDGSNGVPAGFEDDPSMAMGWDFTLAADEVATITLSLSEAMPASGFYLSQTDPDSAASIYFQGLLAIGPAVVPVPEPQTLGLLAMGVAALGLIRVRRFSAR